MKKVRIVKVDSRNFAVQAFETIQPRTKKDEQPGLPRTEWVDQGYFGHRLDQAARFAISDSFETGELVTPDAVAKAVQTIVSETQKLMGRQAA